ncbi:MAG: hypothetical protein ABH821_00640 [archaeon]
MYNKGVSAIFSGLLLLILAVVLISIVLTQGLYQVQEWQKLPEFQNSKNTLQLIKVEVLSVASMPSSSKQLDLTFRDFSIDFNADIETMSSKINVGEGFLANNSTFSDENFSVSVSDNFAVLSVDFNALGVDLILDDNISLFPGFNHIILDYNGFNSVTSKALVRVRKT